VVAGAADEGHGWDASGPVATPAGNNEDRTGANGNCGYDIANADHPESSSPCRGQAIADHAYRGGGNRVVVVSNDGLIDGLAGRCVGRGIAIGD